MQNQSCKNEFDLHENEPVGGTHFHMNGSAHEDSFWHRGKRQLGNGLLETVLGAGEGGRG